LRISLLSLKPRAAGAARALALAAFSLVAASSLLACSQPETSAKAPTGAPSPVAHQPARIIDVLPDNSTARLVQAKELAVAAIHVLEPEDEIIVVRSDFSLVTSQVVPGSRSDPTEVAECAKVSVGGASPRCQEVALAEQRLQQWRAGLVQQVAGVQAKSDGLTPPDDCRLDSGWPSQKVLQLLLAFGDVRDADTVDILILGGGDADARGDAPRLPASYLSHVEVVDAPYTMTCGSPTNLEDWFQDAAGVRLFGAERPASDFPRFLFQQSSSVVAGKAR